jgi:hypothetical protein
MTRQIEGMGQRYALLVVGAVAWLAGALTR